MMIWKSELAETVGCGNYGGDMWGQSRVGFYPIKPCLAKKFI